MFAILPLFHSDFDALNFSRKRRYQQFASRHANVTTASWARNTSGSLVNCRNQR
jgi:hypothetical protein